MENEEEKTGETGEAGFDSQREKQFEELNILLENRSMRALQLKLEDMNEFDVAEFLSEIDEKKRPMTTETLPDENGVETEWDAAVIGVCIYDKNPFRCIANYLDEQPVFLTDAPYTNGAERSGGGMSTAWTAIRIYRVPVHRGQKTVTAQYDLFGTYFTVEVPLYWGDGHG